MSMKTILLLSSVLLFCGCATVDLQSLLNPELEEQVVVASARKTRHKILLLDIGGIISTESIAGGWFSRHCTPDAVCAVLDRARHDRDVKALVVRLDTPGGEVTASDMIHRELLRFKAETGMPVYAAAMGLACSGGYYIATAADRIYAQPTTITGSIGVIARFPRLVGLADKVGYEEVIFQSGPLKAMGHPLREMSPETRQVFQGTVDAMYERFLEVIVAGRPAFAAAGEVRGLADGRIYTADQALDLRLVDEIAYLPEVFKAAAAAAGIMDATVVSYLRGHRDDATIYSSSQGARPEFKLADFNLGRVFGHGGPGFFYLWYPGGSQ